MFAAVSLNGAVVWADKSGEQAMYGEGITHREILDGKVAVPPSPVALIRQINASVMEARRISLRKPLKVKGRCLRRPLYLFESPPRARAKKLKALVILAGQAPLLDRNCGIAQKAPCFPPRVPA